MVLAIVPSAARGQTLGEALNATNLTWTTSGTLGGWSPEMSATHDGISAAESGRVASSFTSTLQTTVNGPGTLTFWWNDPSMYNRLSFSVGGTALASIILYFSWQQQTFYIGEGSQTLKWVYSVSAPPGDTSRGHVDQVVYTPGATAPLITSQPTGQSQVVGLNATFNVSAGGTPPLSYHGLSAGRTSPEPLRPPIR